MQLKIGLVVQKLDVQIVKLKIVKEEFPALAEDPQTRKERRQAERRQRIAKRKAVDDIDPTSVKEAKMNYASAVHSAPKQEVPEVPVVPVVSKPSMSKLSKMSWAEMALLDDEDDEE